MQWGTQWNFIFPDSIPAVHRCPSTGWKWNARHRRGPGVSGRHRGRVLSKRADRGCIRGGGNEQQSVLSPPRLQAQRIIGEILQRCSSGVSAFTDHTGAVSHASALMSLLNTVFSCLPAVQTMPSLTAPWRSLKLRYFAWMVAFRLMPVQATVRAPSVRRFAVEDAADTLKSSQMEATCFQAVRAHLTLFTSPR